jgi:hypothetical protein
MMGDPRMEKKATRRDAGQPRYTERDTWLHPWIGDMYCVRFDHLQELISRQPMGETQEEGWVGEATVRHWIERWRRASVIGHRSVLVGQPSWVWLTRQGLQTFGLDYRYWQPNPARLRHLHYCNQVRLYQEERKLNMTWRSERALRAEQEALRKGERAAHLPDAEMVFTNGFTVAIECELSVKNEARLHDIFYDVGSNYGAVWYFTPPKIKPHIEKALESMPNYPTPPPRDLFEVVEMEEDWE